MIKYFEEEELLADKRQNKLYLKFPFFGPKWPRRWQGISPMSRKSYWSFLTAGFLVIILVVIHPSILVDGLKKSRFVSTASIISQTGKRKP
jgi:hypothetical protein